MTEAGLTVETDAAGNVFGRLIGQDDSQSIAYRSHLEAVAAGGNFDGVLGVLAALEVAEAWQANNYNPQKSFEVVIFTDEEGARFSSGVFGSRAFMGYLDDDLLASLEDDKGQNLSEVLKNYGSSLDAFKKMSSSDWSFFVLSNVGQVICL